MPDKKKPQQSKTEEHQSKEKKVGGKTARFPTKNDNHTVTRALKRKNAICQTTVV